MIRIWSSSWAEAGRYDQALDADGRSDDMTAAIRLLRAQLPDSNSAKARALKCLEEERERLRRDATGSACMAGLGALGDALSCPARPICALVTHQSPAGRSFFVEEHGFDARSAIAPPDNWTSHEVYIGDDGDLRCRSTTELTTVHTRLRLWRRRAGDDARRALALAWESGDAHTFQVARCTSRWQVDADALRRAACPRPYDEERSA